MPEHRIVSTQQQVDYTTITCACGWTTSYAVPNPLYPLETQPRPEMDRRRALDEVAAHIG